MPVVSVSRKTIRSREGTVPRSFISNMRHSRSVVEKGGGTLRVLSDPRESSVFSRKDRPQRPNGPSVRLVHEMDGVQGGVGAADLVRPMKSSVLRVQDIPSRADRPPQRGSQEGEA